MKVGCMILQAISLSLLDYNPKMLEVGHEAMESMSN
jgi:hypothetical protein